MGAVGGRGAAGIGLVDVCVAVATVGVLTVGVVAAVPRWADGASQRAEVQSLQRLLREAQQEAIGEGRPRCVETATLIVRRGACGPDREGVTFFGDGAATPRAIPVGSDTLTVDSSGSTSITKRSSE